VTDNTYDRLADALNRLPNGFPRTPSGVELRLLEKIFTPEEAEIASQLGRDFEPVPVIAKRLGLFRWQARRKLIAMARHGLVRVKQRERKLLFRLMPFVFGIYEFQLERMDAELARLFEEYFMAGGVIEMMGTQPAIHRVAPAQKAVEAEWVLPYDDVRALLMSSKVFNVRDCICRHQQDLLESRRCDYPVEVCLSFFRSGRPPMPGDISKEEALALLDRTEEIGLVHTVHNQKEGLFYVCNCCGCCCGFLRGILEHGVTDVIAYANYYAVIDPEECVGCLTCMDRCHVGAISLEDEYAVVDREKCIGCGLCATGCPNGVARLVRKPEAEIIHPPANFREWEDMRLRNRGMSA
jgi:electron transport complex protein RnfB